MIVAAEIGTAGFVSFVKALHRLRVVPYSELLDLLEFHGAVIRATKPPRSIEATAYRRNCSTGSERSSGSERLHHCEGAALLVMGRVVVGCGEHGLVATVEGDTGTWRVRGGPGRWSCSCPSRRRCSHIEAAERVTGR